MWPSAGGMPLNEFTTEGYFTPCCRYFPLGSMDRSTICIKSMQKTVCDRCGTVYLEMCELRRAGYTVLKLCTLQVMHFTSFIAGVMPIMSIYQLYTSQEIWLKWTCCQPAPERSVLTLDACIHLNTSTVRR